MVQPIKENLAISNKTMHLPLETKITFPEVCHKDIIVKVQKEVYVKLCTKLLTKVNDNSKDSNSKDSN